MAYQDHRYSIKVRSEAGLDGHSSDGDITSGCLYRVFDAGTGTESTLYADKERTAKTNIVSRTQFNTDEGIEFYAAASSCDIFIADDKGNVGKFAGVTPNTRSITLNTTSPYKTMVAEFASDTSETDLGVDFPYGAHITRCFLEVITVDAGEDIAVGLLSTETGGDANGLLVTASVATAGLIDPIVLTVGSNVQYVSAIEYGALMYAGTEANDVGTDLATDVGLTYFPGHHVTGTNAVSLCYTASAGSDTGLGLIYCDFVQR